MVEALLAGGARTDTLDEVSRPIPESCISVSCNNMSSVRCQRVDRAEGVEGGGAGTDGAAPGSRERARAGGDSAPESRSRSPSRSQQGLSLAPRTLHPTLPRCAALPPSVVHGSQGCNTKACIAAVQRRTCHSTRWSGAGCVGCE
eukprot:1642047-Rhodomonas_salina.2